MFNTCPGCGEYSDERIIDPNGPLAVCAHCGHQHRFVRLPLLVVTGASCTGKSTVALQLASTMNECVCMESDILWRDEFNQPENNYKQYRNLWLRVAKNISQSGRPVVLFGTATPGQFEQCPESRYFSGISYLAFVCDEAQLTRRLKARPGWRKSGTADVLEKMIQFNQWLINNAATTKPPMTLLDTSDFSLEQSAAESRAWIKDHLRKI
jgi:predicted kinase